MPATNYMLLDLSQVLPGLMAFGLLLVVPGYALGFLTDALAFRGRTLVGRLMVATALGIAVGPVVTHLMLLLGGFGLVSVYYAAWLVVFLIVVVREGRNGFRKLTFQRRRYVLIGSAFAGFWVLLAVYFLIDLQVGQGLYLHHFWDYIKHYIVSDAVARTGVPPLNPAYQPVEGVNGQPVYLYYYYFWHMMCGTVEHLFGSLTGMRGAVISGTVWAGLGLISITAITARDRDGGNPWRRSLIAVLLLAVGGLDLIPVLGEALAYTLAGEPRLIPFVEMWNRGTLVYLWVLSALGVPQHVGGLVAALTGLLLVREALERKTGSYPVVPSLLAAVALASACGMSIWIGFVAAVFLVVYLADMLVRREYTDARRLVVIGIATGLLLLPFILELMQATYESAFPLGVHVREFRPMKRILERFGMVHHPLGQLAYLVCLPLNYGLEFGVYLVGVYAFWRRHRGKPVVGRSRFELILLLSSLAVCTFIKSALTNNDLGWRGMMLVQFVVLIWLAGFLDDALERAQGRIRDTLRGWKAWAVAVMLLMGALASGYDFTVQVLSIVTPRVTFGGPPYYSGQETLGRREVHTWIDRNTLRDAVVQSNPAVWENLFHGYYVHRQSRALEENHGMLFSIRRGMYNSLAGRFMPIFTDTIGADSVAAIARSNGVDYLIVNRDDPVWRIEDSWVWRTTPAAGNEYARVYDVSSF